MERLVHQRCLHHAEREAVARCPECGNFFCRECITEHDDRVICAACLKRLVTKTEKSGKRFASVAGIALSLLGFAVAWLFFYETGRVLLRIPDSFHRSTVWDSDRQ